MGILNSDCPQCRSKNVTFRIFGWAVPETGSDLRGPTPLGFVAATCTRCDHPALFYADGRGESWEQLTEVLRVHGDGNMARNLSATFAKPQLTGSDGSDAALPECLPLDVLKALKQAERNFDNEGHEEAAAIMYRRALERAIKYKHPDLGGGLAGKIASLAKQGVLPATMAEWANEIRLIGNDGAHDDEVTRADLKAARAFCDAFLRYLISLPAMVDLRRYP